MARLVIDARESGTSTGRYVDKLVENLHKLGPKFEVVILAKSPRLQVMKQVGPNFEIVQSDYKEFSFGEQFGLLRQVRSLNPDLVHFTMTQQPIWYKGRTVTTIHDLTTLRFANPAKNKAMFKVKQGVYARVVKRVAEKSDSIITPSKYVKQDVAQYANISSDKIFVTYEAADKIAAAAEPVPRLVNKQFIMYVGRATPHKNLKRLVQAFLVLRRKYPDLILALAGKMDANYKRLEAQVSHNRLADKVVFTDFVSEGQLKWMYQTTAAYVFPSLSEGFGLPGLEAMAHGAPVVAAKASSLPEIYGDSALYFDPRITQDMAQKISHVLSDSHLRAQLVKKGADQAGKYSWRRTAQETLEIYHKLLDINT